MGFQSFPLQYASPPIRENAPCIIPTVQHVLLYRHRINLFASPTHPHCQNIVSQHTPSFLKSRILRLWHRKHAPHMV